jgi:hypothetical protein
MNNTTAWLRLSQKHECRKEELKLNLKKCICLRIKVSNSIPGRRDNSLAKDIKS